MRYIKEFGRVMLDVGTDWDYIWRKYVWYEFKIINIEVEWDKYCGSLEFMLSLIGFNLRIAIAIPNKLSEKNDKKWAKILQEFDKEHPSMDVNKLVKGKKSKSN